MTEDAMSTNNDFLRALDALKAAALAVDRHWDDYLADEAEHPYPFSSSFDETAHDIAQWVDSIQEVATASRRIHVEVPKNCRMPVIKTIRNGLSSTLAFASQCANGKVFVAPLPLIARLKDFPGVKVHAA
jgi:hypothetical protein